MTGDNRVGRDLPRSGNWVVIARVALALILATALAPGWLGGPERAIAADTSAYSTTSTFELVPGSGLVHVTVNLTVSNYQGSTKQSYTCTEYYFDPYLGVYVPYTTTCTTTTSYYINNAVVVVDPEGTNFRATTPGGSASITVKSGGEGFLSNATLYFPAVNYGQTRTITVTYDLIGGAPRSVTYARTGRAYARFCGFLAGAYLGTRDSMRIVVPASYTVSQYAGQVVSQVRDATTVEMNVPERVRAENSDLSQTCVEARDPGSYVSTHLTSASGVKVQINAWPEDASWLATMSDAALAALDALEEAIGRPPGTDEVSIEEVATENLRGYGGEADVDAHLVRISETAMEPLIATHEVAHLWFSGHFSPESWLIEGYAEYLAHLLTPGATDCEKPEASVLQGIRLSNWEFLPRLPTDEDFATVENQYATACWIVTEIAGKLPSDAIQEIYAAALDSEIAYIGDGPPETLSVGGPILWRRYMDIVDERVLGYSDADPDWLQNLMASVGITDSQFELDARSEARADYHQLLAEADPWAAPFVVRLRMSEWDFDGAEAAMATATEASTLHLAAVDEVAELGDSTTVERAFEDAEDEAALAKARDLATGELKAAKVVGDAIAAADEGDGPLELVGLLGSDLGKDADTAVDALVSGELQKAAKQGSQVVSARDGATTAGAVRLGGAGVVLLGGSGAVVLYRRRKSRRLAVAAPAAPADVSESATDDPSEPAADSSKGDAEDRSA